MPARDFPALLLALITCTRAQSPTYLCELRMSWQELDPPVVTPGYLVQIDADKLTVFAFKCQIYYPRARGDDKTNKPTPHDINVCNTNIRLILMS